MAKRKKNMINYIDQQYTVVCFIVSIFFVWAIRCKVVYIRSEFIRSLHVVSICKEFSFT